MSIALPIWFDQEMQKSAAEARNKNRSALCFGRSGPVGPEAAPRSAKQRKNGGTY